MSYKSTCIADHTKTFKGPWAARRNARWWRKHNNCEEPHGHGTITYGDWTTLKEGRGQ